MQGGALLFQEGYPVLTLEQSQDPRRVWRRPLSNEVQTHRSGRRVMHSANSAEGIRALKRRLGIPPRPTPPPGRN